MPAFTIPDLATYIEAAKTTESYTERENTWRGEIPIDIYRLLHACVGISTELCEIVSCVGPSDCDGSLPLDRTNLKEELGDLWWYAAILCDAAPLEVQRLERLQDYASCFLDAFQEDARVANDVRGLVIQMMIPVGECFDVLKRRVYYGSDDADRKACWSKFRESAEDVVNTLMHITRRCGFTFQEVREANIAKLAKRYPDGFAKFRAIDRDLAGERQVLED